MKIARLFILVFSFLVTPIANASGAVLTVGPNGDYGSIQEAIDVAQFVSQFFEDLPQAADMEGVMTVESDQPISALTLLQDDDPAVGFPSEVPTLTTLPVLPGRADKAAAVPVE